MHGSGLSIGTVQDQFGAVLTARYRLSEWAGLRVIMGWQARACLDAAVAVLVKRRKGAG